ncbi:MAG: TolC family protein [Sulfuricella sp.]|nr:TolC family protein [Sulfuricella sp.]
MTMYRLFLTAFLAALVSFPALADSLANLTLSEAEALWAEHDHEVKLAKRALQGAEADILSAAQRPNPQLSVNVNTLSVQPGVGVGGPRDKMMDSVIGLSQTIERGNKRGLRIQGAEARVAAARGDLADTARQQRLALRQAYYDLRLAQDKLRITEETSGLYRKSVEAAELRLKAGDLAAAEVSRLRVEALRAANDERQAAADLENAQVGLAYLVGMQSQAKTLRAGDDFPAFAEIPRNTEETLEQRADVRAALARVSAAEASRDLARAQKSRDVTVGVQFEHNPTGTTWANNSVGVNVAMPLFVNYAFEGEIRRAEADLDAARDILEKARAQARAELANAHAGLAAAADQVRRYDAALVGEAERVAKAMEFAYQKGALGMMDLLDARRTYRAVQMDAAVARAGYAKALAAWRAAVATGDES